MRPEWHALFAPLPREAVVNRKTVGEGEAIAGWQSVTVELSAGPAGLRHIHVTLDGTGTPIAAGDWVMFATEGSEGITYLHENVGGRLEPDGSFHGTRWRSVTFAKPDSDDAEVKESHHTPPTTEDVDAIRALVREVLSKARAAR